MNKVKAFYGPNGYQLHMPDGSSIPCLMGISIHHNWIEPISKSGEEMRFIDSSTAEVTLYVDVVNEEPIPDKKTVQQIQYEINVNSACSPSFRRGELSDGYHTFDELYEHRNQLFISLCKSQHYIWHAEHWDNDTKTSDIPSPVYKTRVHFDGESSPDGYFVLMLDWGNGRPKQMSYHLPDRLWNTLDWCPVIDKVRDFDCHTSADVLKRLAEL